MKTFFPIRKTNTISKQMLIQPMFVDQRLKSPKKIKGLGENFSWSQNTILRAVEKDIKKGIRNFLLFIVPKEKQKLPESGVFAENRLFATLDSTVRRHQLRTHEILLSDTVGFIRKLPHHLVQSFKSTLDEVREADLLIHLVDGSSTMVHE